MYKLHNVIAAGSKFYEKKLKLCLQKSLKNLSYKSFSFYF